MKGWSPSRCVTTLKTATRETNEELTPETSASQSPYSRRDLSKFHRGLQRRSPAEPNPSGGGVLLISSHGDDRRIFLGLKSSILGFLGVGINLKICGGTCVSPGHVVLQVKYNQICFATFFKVRGVNFWTMDFLGF